MKKLFFMVAVFFVTSISYARPPLPPGETKYMHGATGHVEILEYEVTPLAPSSKKKSKDGRLLSRDSDNRLSDWRKKGN